MYLFEKSISILNMILPLTYQLFTKNTTCSLVNTNIQCHLSGMKILQWLEINNISKDQYYYWQKKLKETCIDTFERQAATFVELPVTKEVPASTELTITHTICENKNDGCSFKDNTIAAVIKTNGVTFEITNTATPDFIKNLIEAFNHT